jgi:hypothetical protein
VKGSVVEWQRGQGMGLIVPQLKELRDGFVFDLMRELAKVGSLWKF